MDKETRHTRIKNMILWAFFVCLGTVLRYVWIFVAHPWATPADFREKYLYSDMLQYWLNAEKLWNPAYLWNTSDTLTPPGTGYLFSMLLGPSMDRISVFQITQFVMTMAIFLLIPVLAASVSGRKAALISFALSAVCFPLFDYGAYLLSETPFTLFLLLAILILCLSLKIESLSLCLLSGLCFGLSATFKSVGLIAAFFVALAFASRDMRRPYCCRGVATMTFLCGILLLVTPASIEMTRRNGGRFLGLSNDIFRIAIVNHDQLLGAHAFFPEGGEFTVVWPVGLQKGYTQMREIPWSRNIVLRENIIWVIGHPLKATLQMAERTTDFFIGTIPFPTSGTRFRLLASLSQKLTFFFIYIPALLAMIGVQRTAKKNQYLLLCILTLPICGLLFTGIIAHTEPRYLHPFLPSLIVMASLFYERIFERLMKKDP